MASHGMIQNERGCFQCSRRRIVCDKAEPFCAKCVQKGIDCSGRGRIRFVEGVARRGRFKNCKIPREGQGSESEKLTTIKRFQSLRWPGDHPVNSPDKVIHGEDGKAACLDVAPVAESLKPFNIRRRAGIRLDIEEEQNGHDIEIEKSGQGHRNHISHTGIASWIAPINPHARMLFSYFSETVAPAMVVLDDSTNGYRSLVIPMAFEDVLLRSAVIVVAKQHLSHQRPDLREAAEAERAAVIFHLRRNSLELSADKVFNKFTWATLIVLLVGETVTGSADFHFFIQMLFCLSLNNPSRYVDPALLAFLQTQTQMFKLLSVPLLGEEIGIHTMMKASEHLMSFLSYPNLAKDSDDRRIADLVQQCFVFACDIYTRCATTTEANSSLNVVHNSIREHSIEQLIDKISKISHNARGAHALVWVCFVAGASSTSQTQKAFLVERMNQVYERTKFRNIPKAICSLEKIWSREDENRWTQSLPELSNVLVM